MASPLRLASSPTTKHSVLVLLKKLGEATADDLALELEITPSAVRQQLAAMTAAGLLASRKVTGGVGRPRQLFRLTAESHALFPHYHGEVANELLEYLQSESPGSLDKLLHKWADGQVQSLNAQMGSSSGPERLERLAVALDEAGYLAEVQPQDHGWLLVEHNCPWEKIGRRFPQMFEYHRDALSAVMPEAEVSEVEDLTRGDFRNAYHFRFPIKRGKRRERPPVR